MGMEPPGHPLVSGDKHLSELLLGGTVKGDGALLQVVGMRNHLQMSGWSKPLGRACVAEDGANALCHPLCPHAAMSLLGDLPLPRV